MAYRGSRWSVSPPDCVSGRTATPAEPRAVASGHPRARGRVRPQHRRASVAPAAQAGGQGKRPPGYQDRTGHRLHAHPSSRAPVRLRPKNIVERVTIESVSFGNAAACTKTGWQAFGRPTVCIAERHDKRACLPGRGDHLRRDDATAIAATAWPAWRSPATLRRCSGRVRSRPERPLRCESSFGEDRSRPTSLAQWPAASRATEAGASAGQQPKQTAIGIGAVASSGCYEARCFSYRIQKSAGRWPAAELSSVSATIPMNLKMSPKLKLEFKMAVADPRA
jgi:hypothetical protein